MNITFDPYNHKYYSGNQLYLSTTQFVSKFFDKFDGDKIIAKMKKSKNWATSPYFGMTNEAIKQQWKNSADLGTQLHKDIELFLTDKKPCDKKEFEHFAAFHAKMEADGYKFHTAEMICGDHDAKIAGMADVIYKKEDTYHLVDWKRVKEVKKDQYERALSPINHMYDNAYSHYALQQNMYKYLLRNSGIIIETMRLVCIHPDNSTYVEEFVPDLQSEIQNMIQYYSRWNNLSKYCQ